jgi:hypothetical protein
MKASPDLIDGAVKTAQSLPDLIAKLDRVDPALAARIASPARGPWGHVVVGAAAYVSTKYGCGWDQHVDELVGGAALVAGGYLVSGARIAFVAARQWLAARAAPPAPPVKS